MKPAWSPTKVTRKVRCAVYTRKSSEEGLDMEFHSVDAQREACEAYIASQKPEGWVLVHDRYDDGGVSGGALERPALKRLLADIELGKVDVVVVYKIDRLSRSLMDFAKLLELFERGTSPSSASRNRSIRCGCGGLMQTGPSINQYGMVNPRLPKVIHNLADLIEDRGHRSVVTEVFRIRPCYLCQDISRVPK
jgi:resolvase-like protein